MPTLIRLVVILLVLVGLVYGAMFGLVAVVDPGEKDVTVKIPARELVASPERAPVVRREINTTRTAPAAEPAPVVEPAPTTDPATPVAPATGTPASTDGSIVTVAPPGIE
jgi:hypothetical protein